MIGGTSLGALEIHPPREFKELGMNKWHPLRRAAATTKGGGGEEVC